MFPQYYTLEIYFGLFDKVVEDTYDGPHLEDGKVTFEFVEQLLTRFKDQKKIHKKYAYTVRILAFLLSFSVFS